MRLFSSISLMILFIYSCSGSENSQEIDFQKMKVKDIKIFLQDRGLECKGCSEKSEFVKLAEENRETPSLKPEKIKPVDPKSKDIDYEELLKNLKGFGGNVYTADDIKNMKFNEDTFGKKKHDKKKTRKTSSTSNPNQRDSRAPEFKEEDSETIEL